MKNKKITVYGRVQGVGFRYFTKNIAKLYDIKGTVRNKLNGSVEIYASARNKNMELFIENIRKGPTLSRVDRISIDELQKGKRYVNFEIKI